MLDGDANVLLEGASVFYDLVLLAKGRQEVLAVLIAGLHYAKAAHYEIERDVAGRSGHRR